MAGWGADPLLGRMLGLGSLQISPCLVFAALLSSPRLSASTTHPSGLSSPPKAWGEHLVPSPDSSPAISQPQARGWLFSKVIKHCTCKTLHSGKQIMQNTLSGISLMDTAD